MGRKTLAGAGCAGHTEAMRVRSLIAVVLSLLLRTWAGAALAALPAAEVGGGAAPTIALAPIVPAVGLAPYAPPVSPTLFVAAPTVPAPRVNVAPAGVLAQKRNDPLAAQHQSAAALFDQTASFSLEDVEPAPPGQRALMFLEEPARHFPLAQTRLASAVLSPRLSAEGARTVAARLAKRGFRVLGRPEPGKALPGEANPRDLKSLSRVRGVRSIERTSATLHTIYVWRDGKRSSRAAPENPEPSDFELWTNAPTPRGTPPRTLAAIRQAAEKGVTIVLPGWRPVNEEHMRDNERLYGARVFYAEDLADHSTPVKLPGLVLPISPSPKSFLVRGDLNPLLGQGRLLARLDKVTESAWVRSADPSFMAKGLTGQALVKKRTGAFKSRQAEVRRLIEEYIGNPDEAGADERQREVAGLVKEFFRLSREKFPKGAFIKFRTAYATRESASMVATFLSDPDEMAADYLSDLKKVKDFLGLHPISALDPELRRLMTEGPSRTAVIHALIARPGDVLVQEKLDLAKNRRGELIEFRVDVLDGHVVNSRFRYGWDYRPDEESQAKRLIESFLDRLPEKGRYFSGGFDVAKRRDGDYVIIETNPGTQSFSLDAGRNPTLGNAALSNLLGKPTPLLRKLERLHQAGVKRQAAFLRRLPLENDNDKDSIRDMDATDAMEWFRARYVQDWRKAGGGRRAALKTIGKLKRLAKLSGHADVLGFTYLAVEAVASYFKRQGVRL